MSDTTYKSKKKRVVIPMLPELEQEWAWFCNGCSNEEAVRLLLALAAREGYCPNRIPNRNLNRDLETKTIFDKEDE